MEIRDKTCHRRLALAGVVVMSQSSLLVAWLIKLPTPQHAQQNMACFLGSALVLLVMMLWIVRLVFVILFCCCYLCRLCHYWIVIVLLLLLILLLLLQLLSNWWSRLLRLRRLFVIIVWQVRAFKLWCLIAILITLLNFLKLALGQRRCTAVWVLFISVYEHVGIIMCRDLVLSNKRCPPKASAIVMHIFTLTWIVKVIVTWLLHAIQNLHNSRELCRVIVQLL